MFLSSEDMRLFASTYAFCLISFRSWHSVSPASQLFPKLQDSSALFTSAFHCSRVFSQSSFVLSTASGVIQGIFTSITSGSIATSGTFHKNSYTLLIPDTVSHCPRFLAHFNFAILASNTLQLRLSSQLHCRDFFWFSSVEIWLYSW